MMVDMKMIKMILKHVIHSFPLGVELPLLNKYENFFYSTENKLKYFEANVKN